MSAIANEPLRLCGQNRQISSRPNGTHRLGQDGIWRIEGLTLPVPGPRDVKLEILISDFEMRRIKDAVVIRP